MGFSGSAACISWQLCTHCCARAPRCPQHCAGPARATLKSLVPQQPWALLAPQGSKDKIPGESQDILTAPKSLLTASQNPRPSRPAAPHRRNKREGGDIIQSGAEKCLNLISVGHGHNRISPVRWNIVSMFPQRWIIVLRKPALGAQWENVPWGWEGGRSWTGSAEQSRGVLLCPLRALARGDTDGKGAGGITLAVPAAMCR